MFILALVCLKGSRWTIRSLWLKSAQEFALRAGGELIFDFKHFPGTVLVRVPEEFEPSIVGGWFTQSQSFAADLKIYPFHRDFPEGINDLELIEYITLHQLDCVA